MTTKLPDGRGQSTLKGREITDEWENLVRKAAERARCTVAKFVVDHTTAAAQAIIKSEPVGPVALPIRLEDIHADLTGRMDQLAAEQAARDTAQATRHAELRREIERQARQARRRR